MKYPPSETVPNKPKTPPPLDDDVWLLVDADTSESEEVFVNRLNFTEQDIMSLLHQIPFFSVVKFITEGSHLSPGQSYFYLIETKENYSMSRRGHVSIR